MAMAVASVADREIRADEVAPTAAEQDAASAVVAKARPTKGVERPMKPTTAQDLPLIETKMRRRLAPPVGS